MDQILSVLTGSPFWLWFVLAGVLLIGELITGTTVLLYPMAAAAVVGLVTIGALDGAPALQWLLFGGVTAGLVFFGKEKVEAWVGASPSDAPTLNEASSRVGQRAVATGDFTGGQGRVRLGDTDWQAEAAEPLATGQFVTVTGVRGTVLTVAPL